MCPTPAASSSHRHPAGQQRGTQLSQAGGDVVLDGDHVQLGGGAGDPPADHEQPGPGRRRGALVAELPGGDGGPQRGAQASARTPGWRRRASPATSTTCRPLPSKLVSSSARRCVGQRQELPGEDELVAGVGRGLLQRAVEAGLPQHQVGPAGEQPGGDPGDQHEGDRQPAPQATRGHRASGHRVTLPQPWTACSRRRAPCGSAAGSPGSSSTLARSRCTATSTSRESPR